MKPSNEQTPAGVSTVDAVKRQAAQKVVVGVEAGRQAFRDGKPRDALTTEAQRIGWDEEEYNATHGVNASDPTGWIKANRCRTCWHMDGQTSSRWCAMKEVSPTGVCGQSSPKPEPDAGVTVPDSKTKKE